ncbi:hypothetical protein C1645_817375 [Glomus cerebriforme]|uniref:Uncharacterized protein n=1 Tax=Glomus cerebriforme TaxID=658196 RepID=A0A397TJ55_9GLOM|nr:hypothetical protein C1645_817375 [Glomus cerebriforme]
MLILVNILIFYSFCSNLIIEKREALRELFICECSNIIFLNTINYLYWTREFSYPIYDYPGANINQIFFNNIHDYVSENLETAVFSKLQILELEPISLNIATNIIGNLWKVKIKV